MAADAAVRMESRANGDTTHCHGCGPRSFPARRVTAGGTAALRPGFLEQGWQRITSARQWYRSKVQRSSLAALLENPPQLLRWIDSKTGSRAVWRKVSIFLIRTCLIWEGVRSRFIASYR